MVISEDCVCRDSYKSIVSHTRQVLREHDRELTTEVRSTISFTSSPVDIEPRSTWFFGSAIYVPAEKIKYGYNSWT